MIFFLEFQKKLKIRLDSQGEFCDIVVIKPAAPLQVCAIRRVFFCPNCLNVHKQGFGIFLTSQGLLISIRRNFLEFFFFCQERKGVCS